MSAHPSWATRALELQPSAPPSSAPAPESARQASGEQRLTCDGQVTDRYNAAVANLGDTAEEVRIGGLYALQRIAQDSPRDAPTVVQVISAHDRDHAPLLKPGTVGPNHPANDVDTALSILATPLDPVTPVDLDGADLTFAGLTGVDLLGADLHGAVLRGANLARVHLQGADLDGANLTAAKLRDADLTGAEPDQRNPVGHGHDRCAPEPREPVRRGPALREPDDRTLADANLADTYMADADLTGANLADANLRGTNLDTVRGYTPSSKAQPAPTPTKR